MIHVISSCNPALRRSRLVLDRATAVLEAAAVVQQEICLRRSCLAADTDKAQTAAYGLIQDAPGWHGRRRRCPAPLAPRRLRHTIFSASARLFLMA